MKLLQEAGCVIEFCHLLRTSFACCGRRKPFGASLALNGRLVLVRELGLSDSTIFTKQFDEHIIKKKIKGISHEVHETRIPAGHVLHC